MPESVGHRLFVTTVHGVTYEYFVGVDGALYRADVANPIDAHGYRQGARFESYRWTADAILADVRSWDGARVF